MSRRAKFIGIEYGRGCLRDATDGGCADAPRAVHKMFPTADWTFVTPEPFDADECARDRFGENFKIQKAVFEATDKLCKSSKDGRHIMIGGDHSVNFGHFAAVADNTRGELCLVYIDAHLDIHTPESARAEASGAPHGTNVRALLGAGDARWLAIPRRMPSLRPENLFYFATRSFEPAEDKFIRDNKIFTAGAGALSCNPDDLENAVARARAKIAGRPFVLSFDFDAIDSRYFGDVFVPAPKGISPDMAEFLMHSFHNARAFEFVEYTPNESRRAARFAKKLISIAKKDLDSDSTVKKLFAKIFKK